MTGDGNWGSTAYFITSPGSGSSAGGGLTSTSFGVVVGAMSTASEAGVAVGASAIEPFGAALDTAPEGSSAPEAAALVRATLASVTCEVALALRVFAVVPLTTSLTCSARRAEFVEAGRAGVEAAFGIGGVGGEVADKTRIQYIGRSESLCARPASPESVAGVPPVDDCDQLPVHAMAAASKNRQFATNFVLHMMSGVVKRSLFTLTNLPSTWKARQARNASSDRSLACPSLSTEAPDRQRLRCSLHCIVLGWNHLLLATTFKPAPMPNPMRTPTGSRCRTLRENMSEKKRVSPRLNIHGANLRHMHRCMKHASCLTANP